jgi:hypothetical protein
MSDAPVTAAAGKAERLLCPKGKRGFPLGAPPSLSSGWDGLASPNFTEGTP